MQILKFTLIAFVALSIFSVSSYAWGTWDESFSNVTATANYVNLSSTRNLVMAFNVSNNVSATTWTVMNMTVRNSGDATNTDIAALELWVDVDGNSQFSAASDSYVGTNATWIATRWNFTNINNSAGVNISTTDYGGPTFFVLANISAIPTNNRTIIMYIDYSDDGDDMLEGTEAGIFMINASNTSHGNSGPEDQSIYNTNITRIDVESPGVTINSPTNASTARGTITINATISDCGINNETVYFWLEQPLGTAATAWTQMYNTTPDVADIYGANGGLCNHEFVQTYNTAALGEGSYYVRINATDLAGSENATGNTSLISVDNVYCGDGTCAGTETCSSCPTDCTYCGSGYQPPIIGPTVTQVTSIISSVNTGETGTITYSSPKTNVISVGIVPTETVKSVKVVTEKLDAAPSGIPAPLGTVYTNLEITAFGIIPDQIDYVMIEFRVSKSWLTQNGFTANDISLQRYADGVWTKLSTSQTGEEDDDYYFFEAQSPGFSYFAITAGGADCTVTGCTDGFTCSLVNGGYACVEATACEGKTCQTGQILDAETCECKILPVCQGKTCPESQTLNEQTCYCEEITVADYTWYIVGIVVIITIVAALGFALKGKQGKPKYPIRKKK